ncbi:MAG: beta-propeller fold lactonase family protein [Verrucomicrobiales bacterium]|nr:beta-propeller fold lactonase family protein [Verrucomicrobiales bacterium]
MKSNSFIRLGMIALATFSFFTKEIFADDFAATAEAVGRGTNGLVTPANQLVTPAGTLVELPGIRPNALALSPNGKLLVTAGLTHELVAVDPATGKISQRVAFPSDTAQEQAPVASEILNPDNRAQLSYTGLAFSPDGSRIYMANVNGDLKVFSVGNDGKVSPLYSIALPPANAPHRSSEIPAGIAVSADGKRIYVALNLSNRLAEIDAATGKVLRMWDVGVAPFGVVLCKNKVYVSNWGGRRPAADSVTGPAGRGTLVRVDDRSIASEGSVSVIDLDPKSETRNPKPEIMTGLHACALALSPDQKFLVAANAGSDTLSVIDTRTDEIVETICARQNPGDPFGAQPDALAFDKSGRILYVCNGTQNAVAVVQFNPGESKLLGLIPAGWFPGALAFDAGRKQICVANIKSIATKTERAKAGATGFGFTTHQYCGSLSLIPVPSKAELAAFTQKALANLRYPLLAQARLAPRPDRPPVPVPERVGEPSVFKHVIYVIKENRTYDQVLGDVAAGNGDASLCSFGERVTPNQHQFVRDFVLLDNTCCSGILSADGHNWADSGIATEYVERSFAGWPRSYPSGGGGDTMDALAYSPAGFIWNDALAHGKTVRDFGEFTGADNHWKNPAHKGKLKFLDCYRDFVNGSNEIAYACEPDIEALRPYIKKDWPSWDLKVPDIVRAAKFIEELKQFEQDGNFPDLTIIWLPNDHTSGTGSGSPTPAAQVADNDLAFGQIVEAVSHSKFWTNTCLFAIEDDPQNGWDHVSGYRTTAYVISPFTKRHAVVGTQYNQTSLLRTMELILGLPPMNQMDATATPMFDCFTNTPDFTAYDAVTNNVPLDEMNGAPKKISDAQLRKDAYVSARLPLDKPDQCDEDVLNRILWRATMGTKPYPEWAVKIVDED